MTAEVSKQRAREITAASLHLTCIDARGRPNALGQQETEHSYLEHAHNDDNDEVSLLCCVRQARHIIECVASISLAHGKNVYSAWSSLAAIMREQ